MLRFISSSMTSQASHRFAPSYAGMVTCPLNSRRSHLSSCLSLRRDYASQAAPRIFSNGRKLQRSRLALLAAAILALEQARLRSLCESESSLHPSSSSSSSSFSSSRGRDETNGSGAPSTLLARLSRLFRAGLRVASLAFVFSPVVLLGPAAYATQSAVPSFSDATWRYTLWSIEKAGPTFIKLCQWAATRSDLFPPEFCLRFSVLQDATRGHPWEDTSSTLSKAFGDDWAEVLDIDPAKKPIGSGCIAQVYHGRLKKGVGMQAVGEEVAIKVVHPHIREKVEMDFYILRKVSAFLERLPRLNLEWLSMSDSVEQFRQIMIPQLDLRCEAGNLDKFRANFKDNRKVTFPKPMNGLVTQNVLVESFVRGDPILSFCRPSANAADKEELAKLGVKTVLEMIFMHDFVHGDLHPGNILVSRNASNELTLNLLDCGIVVEMGEGDHKNLVDILGAFIKRDGILAGTLMVDTAKHTKATAEDVRLFCAGIQKMCSDDVDENFLEKVGDHLADICLLACKHKVKLESKFINAALAVEIMEGLACKLHPAMEVQTVALPLVLKAEAYHAMRKTQAFSKLKSIISM